MKGTVRNINDSVFTKFIEPLQLLRDIATLNMFNNLFKKMCSTELSSSPCNNKVTATFTSIKGIKYVILRRTVKL